MLAGAFAFKLHHTGIETVCLWAGRNILSSVQIAPYWNWNDSLSANALRPFAFELYLTGIETWMPAALPPCGGSSNCTLLELKHRNSLDNTLPIDSSNCTIQELKPRTAFSRCRPSSVRIAPYWNWNYHSWSDWRSSSRSNCTLLELKPRSGDLHRLEGWLFKLYLTGLETGWREGHHRCRGSSNCTLLELKLVCESHSLVRILEDEMNLYR